MVGSPATWVFASQWRRRPVTDRIKEGLTENDITGGSSGNVVVHQNLEIVGLIVDGIMETLVKIYDADLLVNELTGQ